MAWAKELSLILLKILKTPVRCYNRNLCNLLTTIQLIFREFGKWFMLLRSGVSASIVVIFFRVSSIFFAIHRVGTLSQNSTKQQSNNACNILKRPSISYIIDYYVHQCINHKRTTELYYKPVFDEKIVFKTMKNNGSKYRFASPARNRVVIFTLLSK